MAMPADRDACERLALRFQRLLNCSEMQARIAAQGRDGAAEAASVTEKAARKLSRAFGMSERDAARALLMDPRGRHTR
jgi:hypothetical protein